MKTTIKFFSMLLLIVSVCTVIPACTNDEPKNGIENYDDDDNDNGSSGSSSSSSKRCTKCHGTGECYRCNGNGEYLDTGYGIPKYVKCSTCKGSGKCPRCKGSGKK